MNHDIEDALAFVPADERDVWVMMAMAVKSELGDAGFDIWDEWSQTAHNYNKQAAKSVWRSCRGSGITINSLFHEAKHYGYRPSKTRTQPTKEQVEARRREAEERQSREGRERARMAQDAAQKAEWILSQCQPECHSYLWSKGFPELQGLVWRPDEETNLLCIPMRVNGKLTSLQMIDKSGSKKFLKDGITSKAELCFDAHGPDYWVEGWATGWSLKLCLQALKMPYRVHVCFSAHNLQRMAHSGFVFADNDDGKAGEKAAIATGLPYWISDKAGGSDWNDLHKQLGTFRASQVLLKWLNQNKRKTA